MNGCKSSSDCMATERLHERYKELAAMFKEVGSGSQRDLEMVLSKFCLQEGVRYKRAVEYLKLLEYAGLVKVVDGSKSWSYNPKAEWELFGVEI